MADESAGGKLNDAEDKPHGGNGNKEPHGGIVPSVADVHGGGASHHDQRPSPKVITQVGNGHDALVQTVEHVLRDIRQQHGQQQHGAHLPQDLQEERPELDVLGSLAGLWQGREAKRNEQRREEVG